jgi:hypothetical protein
MKKKLAILVAAIIFASCTHVVNHKITTRLPTHCSPAELNVSGISLNIEFLNTEIPELSLKKTLELPYFAKERSPWPPRISREVLLWETNQVVVAEITQHESEDIFWLEIFSLARTKGKLSHTSTARLMLSPCNDAEMSVSGPTGQMTLKARVELIGTPVLK